MSVPIWPLRIHSDTLFSEAQNEKILKPGWEREVGFCILCLSEVGSLLLLATTSKTQEVVLTVDCIAIELCMTPASCPFTTAIYFHSLGSFPRDILVNMIPYVRRKDGLS